MIKVLSVFGTRPEAIKMAPVIRELVLHSDQFISKVCVTAQHRDMLDQVLRLFHIKPDYDLNVMQTNQTLIGITTAILEGLEPILRVEQPDWILVQGDTTTVVAASLASFYAQIKVGHIEAGLRTHDKTQPFPEEVNRRIVSVLADKHFAPTEWAAANIRREGVPDDQIMVTGNTVIDAIQWAVAMPFKPEHTVLNSLPIGEKRIILVTAHRRENFGQGIEEICAGLKALAQANTGVHIVYPVHLNPNVQEPVYRLLGSTHNITLLPPLDYQPLIWLMKQSYFIITDSGGIQEEAPGLGKPVLVLRNSTERPEGVEAGVVRLIGPYRTKIVEFGLKLLNDQAFYHNMTSVTNPYGDGRAAARIVRALR